MKMDTVGDKNNLLLFFSELFNKPNLNPHFKSDTFDSEFNKLSSQELNNLSPWLREYISEIQEKIKKNNNSPNSAEIVAHLFNFYTDLIEFIDIQTELPSLAPYLNDKNIYLEKIQNVIIRTEAKADEILIKYFKLNYEDLKKILVTQIPEAKLAEYIIKYKKAYPLPVISKQKVKEGFLFYADAIFETLMRIQMMNINDALELHKIVRNDFAYNQDRLYVRYGFSFRVMKSLLEFHNLFEDEEVKVLWQEVSLYMV